MYCDIGSELGHSGVESAGEGSEEEPLTSSGERRLRARRVRVSRRWLDSTLTWKMTGEKGVNTYNFYLTLMHAFQMVV